jgi:mono/diheme cytochrome c family protein
MRIPRLSHYHQALLLVASVAPGGAADETETTSAEELVFLLQYVAVDYGNAVEDAKIVDEFEYREMQAFSGLLLDQFDVLRRGGAAENAREALVELRDLIRDLAPAATVRSLASGLAATLLDELNLALPVSTPDLERGAGLYRHNCAACHGPTGAGDGPSSAGMEPPPTSFLGSRMNALSPHQIQGAVAFGAYGTAMPSYREALSREEIWDIAFFTMTLREDFAPRRPVPELAITLNDLAARSNEELLAAARRERPGTEPAHIDHYRRSPPPAAGPARLLAWVERAGDLPPAHSSGRRSTPWMGLSVRDLGAARIALGAPLTAVDLPPAGVWVDGVVFAGPASDAGVETGDCVVSVDGEAIHSVADFRKTLSRLEIGKTVSLGIFRDSETFPMWVTIQPDPASLVAP